MKKALIKLGSLAMLFTPLISVSCGTEYSHSQLESYHSQFEGKMLYTYKPDLNLSSFVATGVAGRQYQLSDLGIYYIRENKDLTYTAFFDQFDRYSEALGWIEVNIKITDKRFGGETSMSKRYTLHGFNPTNSTAKLVTDYSFKLMEYQWTTLENKNITDFYDSTNTDEFVERTADEVGLDLPTIPDGLTVQIKDYTRWGFLEDGTPWYKDELILEIEVSAFDSTLNSPIIDIVVVRLQGFNPTREVPEYEDELPEDDELDAFVQTIQRDNTTSLTDKSAYEFVKRFTYTAEEIGFPDNGNSYGWKLLFTVEEVNIYTGTLVVRIGAEALPGTLTDTFYNYNCTKLFTFKGFGVTNRG